MMLMMAALAGIVRAEPVQYLAERAVSDNVKLEGWLAGVGVTNAADRAEMGFNLKRLPSLPYDDDA